MLLFITLKISNDFNAVEFLGCYVATYNVTASLGQPLLDWILYRVRCATWILLCSWAVLQSGWVTCGLAHTSWVFLLGQGLSGLGAVGILRGIDILTINLHDKTPWDNRKKELWHFKAAPLVARLSGPL
jgi:hypothetical protein